MNNKYIAMAVVAILIVAAAVVIIATGNEKSEPVKETGRLLVYGNANNDDYLDERDISYIEDIISGDIEWDEVKHPFADTNTDGEINEQDVDLLRKFLNKEECLMYYLNTWGTKSYVHYPITGNIGVMDWRQADLTVSLGVWDRVIACGTAGMNEKKTPGYTQKAIWGSGYYVDTETVIDTADKYGLDVVLAYTGSDGTAKDLHDDMVNSKSGIDVIAVDRTDLRVMAVTTAVLLGLDEAGQKYAEYCDKILEDTAEKTMDMPEEDVKSVVLVQMFKTTTKGEMSIMVNGPSPHPLYQILEDYTPTKMVTPIEYGSGWYSVTDVEFIINNDPDYIVFTVASSLWSGDISEAECSRQFQNYCDTYFSNTTAYKTGNIIATDHSCFGGQMSYFAAYKVLSLIYPEYITPAEGDKVYNDWHDEGFALWTLDDLPGQKVRQLSDYRTSSYIEQPESIIATVVRD